jgi:hypothetical protein
MKMSRLGFVKLCSMALVASRSALAAIERTTPDPRRPLHLHDVTPTVFRSYIDTEFAVRAPGGLQTRLVLARITEQAASRNVSQFSLIFHGSAGDDDGNYVLRHASLGSFELFMVPFGLPHNGKRAYQACFSRF